MRGEVRNKRLEIPTSDAIDIIRSTEYGVLATVGPDGRPSTSALNHLLVGEDTLYFHTGKMGEKLDNISTNPYGSFFVTGYHDVVYDQFTSSYSSAVAQGKVSVVTDDTERRRALTALVRRYTSHTLSEEAMLEYIEEGLKRVNLLRMDIDMLTGKARHTRSRPGLNEKSKLEF
jgi:nitroimidazol reductase NimA-like FMN-containing flavoprotein (pyridoxamine 5'-phosphate oxidase superfamily)